MMPWEDRRIAPNGRPVMDNFADWFGASKVKLEDGSPMRLFHVTPRDFDAFAPGGDDPTKSGPAIWLGTDAMDPPAKHNVLEGFRPGRFKSGTRSLAVYARIERPLVIDATTREWARSLWGENFPQLICRDILEDVRRDHDGVLYYLDDQDPSSPSSPSSPSRLPRLYEVIVFDARQIKSAFSNSGLYDRLNPSLSDGPLAPEIRRDPIKILQVSQPPEHPARKHRKSILRSR
jgi:hypothetical protein